MLFGRSSKPSSSSSTAPPASEPAAPDPPAATKKNLKARAGDGSQSPTARPSSTQSANSRTPAAPSRPVAAEPAAAKAPAAKTASTSRWPFGSKPKPKPTLKLPEQPIDREIFQRAPGRILQVGILSAEDTLRMLKVAQQVSDDQPIHFAAIDQFDDRDGQAPRLTLKEAHRKLRSAVQSLQLVPGEPYSALVRSANSLGQFDFCIVTRQADPTSLERAWFYFPRMLTPSSVVMQQNESGDFDLIPVTEIARRARAATPLRRAA